MEEPNEEEEASPLPPPPLPGDDNFSTDDPVEELLTDLTNEIRDLGIKVDKETKTRQKDVADIKEGQADNAKTRKRQWIAIAIAVAVACGGVLLFVKLQNSIDQSKQDRCVSGNTSRKVLRDSISGNVFYLDGIIELSQFAQGPNTTLPADPEARERLAEATRSFAKLRQDQLDRAASPALADRDCSNPDKILTPTSSTAKEAK